jgi:D-cysteine desulfhydrase
MSRTDLAPDDAPVLFRRYPALRERIGWLPLGVFPTPVEPLRLAGAGADLWVKRDDLSGEPYGGNKVRKLEFVLAEARRQGAGRLVTAGAAGSHHALATTVYGTASGFPVTLVLFPQPLTGHVREVLLQDVALGAELRWVPRMELIPLALRWERFRCRSERPFLIAPGGSDAHGTLGYVNAALELAEQIERGEAPLPARIYLATGTMGTAAGLALGLQLAGLRIPIEAVRITSPIVTNARGLRSLAMRTARLLEDGGTAEVDVDRALEPVSLRGEFIGEGYGQPTPQGEDAALRLADAGLALDPTYTAKAAAALLAALLAEREAPVLFWHTLSARAPLPADRLPGADALPAVVRRYVDGV